MRDILKLGCILMAYTLAVGVALAFVNVKTAPLIEANKAVAENNARAEVLPDMAGDYVLQDAGSDFPCWIGYRDAGRTEIGGYIFITHAPGYSSTVEAMVGVDTSGAITGVKVLFQQETPGLGAKCEEIAHGESEPWFTRQYRGNSASDDIKVDKDGGGIDSITGATIRSRAITNAISGDLVRLSEIAKGRL